MPRDSVAEVSFELLPVSYLFRRGHRIRLAISGGDPDNFRTVAPPNTAITMHYGTASPSRLDLPIDPTRGR
jgi:predicted acyl esterase